MSFTISDCHVHMERDARTPDKLLETLEKSRVRHIALMSLAPASYSFFWRDRKYTNRERLDHLMEWCDGYDQLHPIYWIDPTEDDAESQVELAVEHGVQGFKVICGNHYPGDPRAMKAYRRMARLNRSVLFHSGILWDGKSSSRYNRPAEWEDLMEISDLKFALAHISWPWVDECIAVLGKYRFASKFQGVPCAKMYIDITPGTPEIYREEAFRKLFQVGYDVEDCVFFGSDQNADDYSPERTEKMVDFDMQCFQKLGLTKELAEKVYEKNVASFYGF